MRIERMRSSPRLLGLRTFGFDDSGVGQATPETLDVYALPGMLWSCSPIAVLLSELMAGFSVSGHGRIPRVAAVMALAEDPQICSAEFPTWLALRVSDRLLCVVCFAGVSRRRGDSGRGGRDRRPRHRRSPRLPALPQARRHRRLARRCRRVGGGDDAALEVAGVDDLEEQGAGFLVQDPVAHLINLCRCPHRLIYADTATIGARDFAIMTLVARLGLRSIEVARMELRDVDWRAGELVVRGKARRQDRLPLPAEAGEALVAYLTRGRAPAGARRLFLTCRAPRGPIRADLVGDVVERACLQASLTRVGPHRLRHALAAELLRQGAGLVAISQVLRHQDLATTALYKG